MSLDTLNLFLGMSVLAMQVAAVVLLAVYVFERRMPELSGVSSFIARRGLWIGLLVTAGAAIFSLVHSHYFGLPPCDLCWWQRIFIYPQVVLFALAAWRRDTSVALYSIALSLIGAGFAAYHHMLQMLPAGTIPCPATGPSCSQILFLEFGYITYPMMALSLFALLIIVMLFVLRRR